MKYVHEVQGVHENYICGFSKKIIQDNWAILGSKLTWYQFWIHSNEGKEVHPNYINDLPEKILIGTNWVILCPKMTSPHKSGSAQGFLSFHQ